MTVGPSDSVGLFNDILNFGKQLIGIGGLLVPAVAVRYSFKFSGRTHLTEKYMFSNEAFRLGDDGMLCVLVDPKKPTKNSWLVSQRV